MATSINRENGRKIIRKYISEIIEQLQNKSPNEKIELKERTEGFWGLDKVIFELLQTTKTTLLQHEEIIFSLDFFPQSDCDQNVVVGFVAPEYESIVIDQLKLIAKDLGIHGIYKKMSKAEAIRRSLKKQADIEAAEQAARQESEKTKSETLEDELDRANTENVDLTQKIDTLKIEIAALREENAQLKNDLSKLQQFKKDYDAAMAVLNDPIKNQTNPPQ